MPLDWIALLHYSTSVSDLHRCCTVACVSVSANCLATSDSYSYLPLADWRGPRGLHDVTATCSPLHRHRTAPAAVGDLCPLTWRTLASTATPDWPVSSPGRWPG